MDFQDADLRLRDDKCFPQMEALAERLAVFQKQTAVALGPILEELAAIDWPNLRKRILQSCERLAGVGWTLPMSFTPRQLVELTENTSSDEELDLYMFDYYTEENGKQLQGLRNRLALREKLTPWHALLEQCFAAYDRNHYLVSIPALLSVIDGIVAENAGKFKTRRTQPTNLAAAFEKDASPVNMKFFVWRSARIVIEKLFMFSDFGEPHPGQLNRHWVLHGRDQTQWTQRDGLRLFNLLETIT